MRQAFHSVYVCVQTVHTANFLLKQILQMRKRAQNVDTQYQQRQCVNSRRNQLQQAFDRGIIERNERSDRALNPACNKLRGEHCVTGQRNKQYNRE